MANQQANLSIGGKVLPVTLVDQGDGSFAIEHAADLRGWDTTTLTPSKLLVDHATGALLVTSTGSSGGGGPVTIADGADVAQGATTDTAAANTVVGLLKAIKAAVQGTLTVATHAVTQSGVWTVARSWTLSSATDSVNVGNFPATQPVSAAALPLPAGAATAANQPTLKAASAIAVATDTASVVQHSPQRADASTLWVTALGGANAAVTLTLPAPAAGLFHYITSIEIVNVNPTVTAIAAAASTLSYTTTNLPGSPAWSCGTLLAAGAEKLVARLAPTTPIKSSAAATPTTIVAPAIGTGGVVRMNVTYYTAP